MWDTYRLPLSGNFSLRKIAITFLAILVSVFLWITLNSTTSFAADGSWQPDGTISFEGKTYTAQAASGQDLDGNVAYVSQDNSPQASIIFYAGNADTTKDIPANVAVYTSTTGGGFINQTGKRPITLSAKPTAAKQKTSCDIVGVGWIMCPVSRAIAKGMDNIFKWVSGFLEVKPISNDTSSGMYKAWEIARGLANLCFILAFLVIIYSQLTQQGLNNYNVKKMIPKLIIASILVNVSYYICSIGVDISNILGHSVQQSLVDVRKSLPNPAAANWLSFQNVTEYVLSGGTIIGAGIAGWAALAGGLGGSVTALAALLLPILLAGALSVIVALLILAARQALITVLIVISPLAFVAFLLPNTEKWFEKWKDLFTTMLFMFPLFSLLFGGSQLAAAIILQNATQFSVVLLALFVQVAPLIMTPFIVKFSGSLLGRLAGMVNNPQKGLVDRSRNWARERADLRKQAAISHGANQRFGLRRMAYKREMGRRNRDGLKSMYEAENDASWHNDKRYHGIHSRNKSADLMKNVGESSGDAEFERTKATNATLNRYVGQQRTNQDFIAAMQKREEAKWEEAKSEKMSKDNRFAEYGDDAKAYLRASRIAQDNTTIAQAMQKSEYATAVTTEAALQAQAGGIGGESGAIKIKAASMAEVVNSGIESVKAIRTASPIKAGDVDAMKDAFEKAIRDNDVASMRAHADMLSESANIGVDTLRQSMTENEAAIRRISDLDTFKHHINGNSAINAGAEDIAVWSRDPRDRTLGAISNSSETWKNLTANQIASMKTSSQKLAFAAKKPDGSWALSQQMARDIVKSPSTWASVKDEMKASFEERAGLRGGGSTS